MVIWQDYATSSPTIRARLFNPLGAPAGNELIIATNTYNASDASVAALADGGFYVNWSNRLSGTEAFIEGNVYSATGALLRYQPVIFDTTIDANPEVARLGSGAALVWEDFVAGKIGLRIFDAGGIGGAVYTDVTPGTGDEVAIASSPDASRLAVVWRGGDTIGVKVYDPAGTAVVLQTAVATAPPGAIVSFPAVAWAGKGVFAVAWTESLASVTEPASQIMIRWFRVTGVALANAVVPATAAIQLSGLSHVFRDDVSLTSLPNGGIVAAWNDGSVVKLQAFDSSGTKIGGMFQLSQAGDSGRMPSLAALPDGRVAAALVDVDTTASAEIHAQIIDPRDGIVTGTSAGATLYGNDLANDEISGLAGNDTLFGMRGDDLLLGGTGDDILDGGVGADEMRGGKVNDAYFMDNVGDLIVEATNGGNDTVQSSLTDLDLANYANVESLALRGSLALNGTGTDGANILDGAGSSGANVLTGLGGSDVYLVGTSDVVVEAVGGGTDSVMASVSCTLAPGAEVEVLRHNAPSILTGLTLTGNAFANTIIGAAGRVRYHRAAGPMC